MNCKHVEELLPLYVGHDLEDERATLVSAHVQTCTPCALSLQEHREANQLLQTFEPPPFSEATFAALRHSVLREIDRSQAPQRIFALDFISRLFQPRLIWAVSTVVLLAVCMFAYYLVANQTSGQQNVAQLPDNRGAREKIILIQQAITGAMGDHSALDAEPGTVGTRDPRTGSLGVGIDSPGSAAGPHKPRLNQKAWHSRKAGESSTLAALPGRGPRPPAVSAAVITPVTADKTLRLEIQTSDPNIRIIWFSHQGTNEGSPSESSKGI